jgi:acetyl esterase/lipase
MRKAAQKYGLAVISADYRFAPQVHVKDILDDVKDCIAFIRNDLPKQVGSDKIDGSRLAVSGSSAGGYLALLAGLYADPKPTVILPIYPITDPLGWFFITSQPPPFGRQVVSREELAPYLDPKGEVQVNNDPDNGMRKNMYVRMMADANLAKLYHTPTPEEAKPYRISRNIYERGLPPTYVLHGDADAGVGVSFVPTYSWFGELLILFKVEQADEVVGAALGCGIEVEYERVHGKDHSFDNGPDYENEKFYSFMLKHLNFGGKASSK